MHRRRSLRRIADDDEFERGSRAGVVRIGKATVGRERQLFAVILRGPAVDCTPVDAEVVGEMPQVTDEVGDRRLEIVVRRSLLDIRNEGQKPR